MGVALVLMLRVPVIFSESRGAVVCGSIVVILFWTFVMSPYMFLGEGFPHRRMLVVFMSQEHVSEGDGALVNL